MPTIVPQNKPNVKPPPAVINAGELLKYTIDLLVNKPWNPAASAAGNHVTLDLDALQEATHA